MNKERLKQDFFEAVNEDWLKTAKIPADKPATGGFQDLVDGIDDLLMKDIDRMLADPSIVQSDMMLHFLHFYQLANDYDSRNQLAEKPLLPLLEQIEKITSFEELNQQFPEWTLDSLPLPFSLDVDADMKNAQTNALFAYPPSLFLPDKTYYSSEHPNGAQLLNIFFDMMVQLVQLAGKDKNQAEAIVEQAIQFDKLVAPHVKSAEEKADYSKMYNPQDFDTFIAHTNQLDLKKLVTGLIGTIPDKVIVTDPVYFEQLSEILTTDHFQLFKSWMIVRTIRSLSGYLSEEFRQVSGIFSRTLSGTDEAMPPKKAAYYLATGQFDQVIGDYYGKTYFGEVAKKDVEQMIQKMILVYKKRLEENNWLSDATRKKAIIKLDKLGVQVGYPEKIPTLFQQYKTIPKEEGGTLLSNALTFSKVALKDRFARWNKPVDRTEWEMSADTVNAYYHPFRNIIVFPAAILQAPFYSLEQSSSANFGGIGAVIAHEISHAFDNNGALFDEYGNLNNWWTEEDLAHFQEKAQAMIEEFDGLPFADGKVNGKLTVSENIADAGGLSCALEAAKTEQEHSLEEFFISWATIWRTKAKKEYQQLLLQIDVHAPAKLRANIQPQNLVEFYETFAITEKDAMYLPPEKRVHIW
ncbi:M13 family metallopeptidase [Enterococcus villorum]|uniref:Peptidase M13 n=2 Tax=Enterococcus villorum TaxID=112904 RepID=A0A511J2X0_9ENTE|nr:M13-type metalloendopeptidase [Enterococcus villorum]EOH92701.1 peptidase M13 [Enterococcus villorum ATCC 700913]EOW75609.1 peptidase M13 [Enterococcus villorum ATCC 700913]GEL92033.1 peptidase M13 [Enterococcus villorum]